MKYYVETVCTRCKMPMGYQQVSEEKYIDTFGTEHGEPQYTDEAGFQWAHPDYDPSERKMVKVNYQRCPNC